MSTLLDGFDEGEHGQSMTDHEPHNIVYGAQGWTDNLDTDTIETLVRTGVIKLDRTDSGNDWETHIYVSLKGRPPY